MGSKFLILEAWGDSIENDANLAFGYKEFAVTNSKVRAKQFCATGGTVSKDEFGWAACEGSPIYRFVEIPSLEQVKHRKKPKPAKPKKKPKKIIIPKSFKCTGCGAEVLSVLYWDKKSYCVDCAKVPEDFKKRVYDK